MAIKRLLKTLSESDILIFSGKGLCQEAYLEDDERFFYLQDTFGLSIGFALGVAQNTEKNVLLFVGEGDLLRDISALAQSAVTLSKNLFIFVINNNVYQDVGKYPNIFAGLTYKKGIAHGFGFTVFDITHSLEHNDLKGLKELFSRVRGPMLVYINVDSGLHKDAKEIDKPVTFFCARFQTFLKKVFLKGTPQIEYQHLNLDELKGGTDVLREHNTEKA